MSLARILEPEVMDSPQEAADYDAMDYREVNERFVTELLAALPPAPSPQPLATFPDVLDLGAIDAGAFDGVANRVRGHRR